MEYFKMLIQDCNGDQYVSADKLLSPYSYLGYIYLDNGIIRHKHTYKKTSVDEILSKGGEVKFILKKFNSVTKYSFTIPDASWYNNAIRKLKEDKR